MNHEAGQEKPDQHRRLQFNLVLVVRSRLGKCEVEQEPADEERRVVRHPHGKGQKSEVRTRHPERHRLFSPRTGIHCHRFERLEFFPKHGQVNGVRQHDATDRVPAKVGEHILEIPPPRRCDHQDRRGRKMRQRAANGDIYEEQPERRVFQPQARIQRVELFREQERANRHRRRFRDQ